MFSTDRFFFKIWALWYWLWLLALLLYAAAPPGLWLIPVIASVWAFSKCRRCAYCSERFSDYAHLRLLYSMLICPTSAFVLSLAITYKQHQWEGGLAVLFSTLALLLPVAAYATVYASAPKDAVFDTREGHVVITESRSSASWFMAGATAGLSGMLYPLLERYTESMTGVLCFLMFLSFYMILSNRKNIAALKNLNARERAEGREYTYSELEHIRMLRQHSFLSRLLGSRRES